MNDEAETVDYGLKYASRRTQSHQSTKTMELKMKPMQFILLLLVVAASSFTVAAQAPAEKRRDFLAVLKVGQSVSVKDVSGRYEIGTLDGVSGVQGYKVLETGADFVVVQDISGVTEMHIPVLSIKAIVRLKVPQK